MKRIINYFSILFTLLITACSNDDISVPAQVENDNETCELTFKVTIPQPAVVSRAFNDGSSIKITSLCLLLFDEDGILVGRKKADEVTNPTLKDNVYQGTYSVELAKTDEKRIIHFVANYPTDINDFPSSGNENSVLSQLNVTGTTDTYWQRMNVDGIRDTDGTKNSEGKYTVDNIPTVRLIRNFVAVEMEMSKDKDEEDNYLVDQDFLQGFVLYNEAKQGTVAPYFRNETGGFAQYTEGISYATLTNSPDATSNPGQGYIGVEPINPTTNRYDKTVPVDEDFTETQKYTYERSYPSDKVNDPTFVIMKGRYNSKIWYYRVDIAKDFKYFHLLRNFRYILQITKTCEGYSNISDAINGSSFNHLVDISIKVEEITDGETTLRVTPTDITVVNGTESVLIDYDCKYTGDGTKPTVSVSDPFTPEINKERTIINSITSPSALSGTLTVGLKSFFTESGQSNLIGGLEIQRFEVRTSNGLTREVRISLVDKINFNPKFMGPDADNLYHYQYTLPNDLPESMFPMEIYLYEETGSFTPESGEQLSVDLIPDPNNTGRQTWRYKKVMTYAEYKNSNNFVSTDNGKVFTAKFKANGTLSGSYTMTIKNDYAYDGSATLQEATIITVTESDDTNDGVLSWKKGITVSEQTITISLNNDSEWNYTLVGENFSVTKDNKNENTLRITPKNTSEEVENTLIIKTEDGMTKKIALKVVGKIIKTLNLTLLYQWDKNYNITANATITNYTSGIIATLGEYDNSTGKWPLTIEYEEGMESTHSITFSYTGRLTFTNNSTIQSLLDNQTVTLTYQW